jgi:dipeptide/tripeptide permease
VPYPRQIKYIIGNEICERFSYHWVMGILELYMAHRLKIGGAGRCRASTRGNAANF